VTTHPDLWHADELVGTGPHRAKVRRAVPTGPVGGRLVLVTATTPTRAGEGKTVTAIGLADALAARGHRAAVTLRTSSLGPTLGLKGGGAGGGAARLAPLDEALLGMGADLFAVESANNLLAAAVDHELRPASGHTGLVADSINWKRVIDIDDRALRSILVHPDGTPSDTPRSTGFDITAASEVMAVLSLALHPEDLRQRLGRIVVGRDGDGAPVTAEDLGTAGAMAALLREAAWPNLLRTAEGTPALVHGGAFANIAHGCTSIAAERLALERADLVVTEAGFGADLGAQKRLDLVVPAGGPAPDAIVLVTTVRALADHGRRSGTTPDDAIEPGLANLRAHLATLAESGLPVVVAVNRFGSDDARAVAHVLDRARAAGAVAACTHTAFTDGAAGASDLAEAVEHAVDAHARYRPRFGDPTPVVEAVERLATEVYGAAEVSWSERARADLDALRRDGLDHLPPCVAKTHLSLSHDPDLAGAPHGFTFPVRSLQARAGAGFTTVYAGEIITMPGLPSRPRYLDIEVAADGSIRGLA